ncbi:MAG: hypothetical protein E7441_10300 [Ruminococcaceae bacterium]|nr:hypothetical protein [Oscillospiraceae bacterium]
MKKRIAAAMLACCLILLSACAERQTKLSDKSFDEEIRAKAQLGEQYEKRSVRMFNVEGDLYYDTGLVSDITPRCGTLDGELEKTVGENEIPQKSGEANFEADGYQNATGITKEVNINGEWVIFKKYNTYGKSLEGLKYCHYIKGRLNNAVADSEIIVLSEKKEITFNDVYSPLLSSRYPMDTSEGYILHNRKGNDKWGITLSGDNITRTGMTLTVEQFGGNPAGELQIGEWFKIEKRDNDKWKEAEINPLIDYAWHTIAYGIRDNDITELSVDWEWLYGKLSPGFYRISKEIMDFRGTGNYDKEIYQFYFTID